MIIKNLFRFLAKLIDASWAKRHVNSPRTLALAIGDVPLHFSSVADFAFSLKARTGVLPLRLYELQTRLRSELESELVTLSALAKRLRAIAADYDHHQTSCADAVARMGTQIFSKDYDWRVIMGQIAATGSGRDLFMRAGLAGYLHYLDGRQEVLRALSESRIAAATGSKRTREHAFAPDQATIAMSLGQRAIVIAEADLQRLPQGEAVTVRLARGATIALKLARHEFALTHNQHWSLVADNGKRYVLRDGLNSVGRGRDNDVALDADFRNVSRRHLLAQPLGSDTIALTDVSSYGTYVSYKALAP